MNWKPVTVLPELDDDGFGAMMLLWVSDGSQFLGWYRDDGTRKGWFTQIGKGEATQIVPRFWCAITPPTTLEQP